MNPCLSGWDKGEAKHSYMHHCHGVLSRSQLNAVAKMRDAGILNSNLVVLPSLSNISLANNGTHLSMGSRLLSSGLAGGKPVITRADEKFVGDLAIKISEHFLPLFVGTYSAAPYRSIFPDSIRRKSLGFLPHELDYTHLRMFWRRWKKKADIKVFGRPVTPFGPEWLDQSISNLFRLKGDFVSDFKTHRLSGGLMSTDRSPSLDGRLGNTEKLRKDLTDWGFSVPGCLSIFFSGSGSSMSWDFLVLKGASTAYSRAWIRTWDTQRNCRCSFTPWHTNTSPRGK